MKKMTPSTYGEPIAYRIPPRAVKFLMALWLASYTAIVYAASFTDIIKGFDYESLMWAMLTALVGGGARTILTLASDKIIVLTLWREMIRDGVIALIGGMVVYVLVQWLATIWAGIFNSALQVVLIAGAGFSRGRWQLIIGDFVSDLVVNLRTRVRGADSPLPPNDTGAPSSVRSPLEQ